MNAKKARALKRVYKDLSELQNNPQKGIGICMPSEADPFYLLINIEI